MNADQVRAYVATKWPDAMQSPVARAVQSFCAAEEAEEEERAVELTREALGHALQCIDDCDAQSIAYDEETLAFNIETNFPHLSLEECDDVAREALEQTREHKGVAADPDAALIDAATHAATDAGCRAIQDALGVTDGDFAGVFFSGGDAWDAVRKAMTDYLAGQRHAHGLR